MNPQPIIDWLVRNGSHMTQSDVDILVQLLGHYYRGTNAEVVVGQLQSDDDRIRWEVIVKRDDRAIDCILVHGPKPKEMNKS